MPKPTTTYTTTNKPSTGFVENPDLVTYSDSRITYSDPLIFYVGPDPYPNHIRKVHTTTYIIP